MSNTNTKVLERQKHKHELDFGLYCLPYFQ